MLRYRLNPEQLDEVISLRNISEIFQRGKKVLKFREWLDEYTELHKRVMEQRKAGKDEHK